MDAATHSSLRSLTVPVNSAAHWEHLYAADGLDLLDAELVDLTSTSNLDLQPTVRAGT